MSDHPLDRDRITQFVSTIFAEDLHAKRVASLAGAAIGALEGAALGIHAIGKALAMAEGLKTKHAVKQVDRLLSNEGIPVWSLFSSWSCASRKPRTARHHGSCAERGLAPAARARCR